MNGPDFSSIDTREKVLALAAKGELEKMFLLPEAFGGEDVPPNIVYVPVGLNDIKAQTDEGVIASLAAEGKVTRYSARPRYSGKSHIPVALEIHATDPGNFVFELRIWGEGLKGEP